MNYKNLGVLIAVVAAVAVISGCTATPPASTESMITRTITPATIVAGGTITVNLNVNVNDERFYLFEEIPPTEWEIVDAGAIGMAIGRNIWQRCY